MLNLDPLIQAIREASEGWTGVDLHSFDKEGDEIIIVLKAIKLPEKEEELLSDGG